MRGFCHTVCSWLGGDFFLHWPFDFFPMQSCLSFKASTRRDFTPSEEGDRSFLSSSLGSACDFCLLMLFH